MPNENLVEIAREMPLVAIARDIPELACQSIPLDSYHGAREAVRYLIESGHRRIAHISGLLDHKDARERKQAYLDALAEAQGSKPDPDLIVEGDYTEPSGVMAVGMLMARGRMFSAVFAANDQMAFGARLGLSRRGHARA